MILIGAVFAAGLLVAGAMAGILAVLAVGNRSQRKSGTLDESQGRAARGTRAITGLRTLRPAQQPRYWDDDFPVPASSATAAAGQDSASRSIGDVRCGEEWPYRSVGSEPEVQRPFAQSSGYLV
jgi:hypothetical protein